MNKCGLATAVLLTLPFLNGETRSIRRLDGTSITTERAAAFAKNTLEATHVTGAQIVVMEGGRMVWSWAFGLRRKDPDLTMDRQTALWAASITKGIFATYVMKLVERGEFQLDLPVVKQLALPLDQYDAYRKIASAVVKDPAWATVTPRMLLAHSSGLANFAFVEPDKLMHLHFKPGTQYNYSGEGLNLLQFVIENRKGQPLDQLMQEALFQPFGMEQTGLIYRPEFASNVVDRFGKDGQFLARTQRFPARAAGSMTASAEDLGRFTAALFAGKIVKRKTMKAMLAPAVEIRAIHQFALTSDEGLGLDAANVGLAYGMGWGLLTKTLFGRAFFKEGHGDGAQNYMICFEKRQACMILLTNSDNGELAFRPLLETIFGDTVTPWEWEGYTPTYINQSRKNQ